MNTIPPITDPLGRSWTQPNHESIVVSDKLALMTQQEFDQLREYSGTIPSGVYPGKMWKAKLSDGTWQLRWFGESGNPDLCTNNSREIFIT